MFETNALTVSPENTDTILITRETLGVGNDPLATSYLQVYSGLGDFQAAEDGTYFVDADEVQQIIDAVVVIDADPVTGALPATVYGDVCTVNGVRYAVLSAEPWSMAPVHIEISLKRGPLKYTSAK